MSETLSPPPGPPWTQVAGRKLVDMLGRRGIGARTLGGAAIAMAGLAAVLLTIHHAGLAACLGLLALLTSELSLLPPADPEAQPSPLPRALALPVDLLLGSGIVAGAATAEPLTPALVFLGLLVLLLLAWLPNLTASAPTARTAPPGVAAGIWRRPDRLAVLLVGALLGRLLPALLLVGLVGAIDAWLRLAQLDTEEGPERPRGPSFLRPLLQPDGRLVPAVRWGTLAIAILILLVLPRAEGWRF